ncbi:aldo/keto reductase [Curtobacterium sp. Leaf261]|uniref:aldo/keto reductase n=1 Tax=Curtobacterium sp. Leaf261 TaxID=1736311 RepID=UPI0006FADD19|nr:aldo/keto reductase [Curtobacterium sp. Leaf261]KQO65163.1 aldo/keto reductase [Curtobacterium sp. Leaf261]
MADTYREPAVTVQHGSMPLLGFGTWQIPDDEAPAAVGAALESGYRHIDTATGYSNERGVGAAIASSGVERSDLFVTTKLPPDHAGRERQTLDESLEKLGIDQLDLWLIHWPPNGEASPSVWEAFIQAQQEGLVANLGVSNYSLQQIDELTAATGVTPAVNQVKWSPAEYDSSFAAGLAERGVVLEGYSPFKASNLQDPTLVSVAAEHGIDTAQVIVAWHVAHEFVVIPKSSQPERIRSNALGATVVLSDDEVASIDALGS